MSRIEPYDDADAAREWKHVDRHRTEMAVTLRAFADYLSPRPARILSKRE